nr:RNA-directed DNA polymerase, eukaryota [Tanacetum cinerariifolium]
MPYSHQVRKRHFKSGTKSNAIFSLPGHGSTSSVDRKSNAIFALPGHGSTSSVDRKSNAIFALPGHRSTSSVGRKSNAIFALPDHGSTSFVGLCYTGSAFIIINPSHYPLVRNEREWYLANASVTPTIENVFFLRGLYRLATGNQASEHNHPTHKVVYLGGLWVMFELPSANSKSKFLAHVGVESWFKSLSNPQPKFSPRDRIIWVDVEGVPMHAWSRNTFHKIGSMWGEVLELGDCKDECFARKRLCIKTNRDNNILEKFKIIVKGKSFVVRAIELFMWSPSFVKVTEADDTHEEGEFIQNGE